MTGGGGLSAPRLPSHPLLLDKKLRHRQNRREGAPFRFLGTLNEKAEGSAGHDGGGTIRTPPPLNEYPPLLARHVGFM